MVFQQLFGGKTAEEVAEAKTREAHEAALKAEIEAASKGTIDELKARLSEYEAETVRNRDDVLVARARWEVNPDTAHREELTRLRVRTNDLATIVGGLQRRIRALSDERGQAMAAAWNKAPGTARLFGDYLAARAATLGPIAALVASHEAESRSGAAWQQMIPLFHPDVAALREFVTFVQSVQRFGVKVDTTGWPASVRDRIAS